MDTKVISTLMLLVGTALLAVFVLMNNWNYEKKAVTSARLVVSTQDEQVSPVAEKPDTTQQTVVQKNQVIDIQAEPALSVTHEPSTQQTDAQVHQVADVQDELVRPVADSPDTFKQTINTVNQEVNGIVLFYGEGCPHCTLVKEYVEANDVEAKVPFVEKEVYHNAQNASELAAKAEDCGLTSHSVGVPFLWDEGTCFIGDKPIIDFFKKKINQY